MTLSRRSNETVKLPRRILDRSGRPIPIRSAAAVWVSPLASISLAKLQHQARFDLLVAGVADVDGKEISGASRDAPHGTTEGLLVVLRIEGTPWFRSGFFAVSD